ncbi:ABC transporter ATP-binding protein [Tissierella praeacuta]|uniref:ABC transporter ATP-binding protein n=1 Tax=Tissierella praeacuta TaxID=43131 RepID=UPI00333F8093
MLFKKIRNYKRIRRKNNFISFLREFCINKKLIILYVIVVLFMILNAILSIYRPKYQGIIIDGLSRAYLININKLRNTLLIFLGMVVVQYVIVYIRDILDVMISEKIAEDLRNKIFYKYNFIRIMLLEKYSLNDIILKVEKDINLVKTCGINAVLCIISNIIIIFSIFPVIFKINLNVFVVTLIMFLLYILTNYILSKKIMKISKSFLDSYNNYVSILSEIHRNIIVSKIFNLYEYTLKRYLDSNREYKLQQVNQEKTYIINRMITILIQYLGLSVTWIIGFVNIIDGNMTIGTLIALISYQSILMNPVIRIVDSVNNFSSAKIALDDLYEFFNEDEINENCKLNIYNIDNIVVDALTYNYVQGDRYIKYDNYSFLKDEKLVYAIVGSSGSGKSTFAKILAGIKEDYIGNILINGKNFRDLNKKRFWECIVYIEQNSHFFDDTMINNVSFDKQIERDEIIQRSKELSLNKEFENRWDEIINGNGNNISTGQAKRLDLLRGIMKNNVSMYIFDEVTENLDYKNRCRIYEILNRLSQSNIVIYITHNEEELKFLKHKRIDL